ncbi:hypothetical protein ACIQVE_06575 [Pseudomonas sp. NPDC098747]|uniref:hypothetical protein n=1 Tax=Pseudomonas sp. NPDC098747 TaxID=3364487 RepID=UPI00383AB7F7
MTKHEKLTLAEKSRLDYEKLRSSARAAEPAPKPSVPTIHPDNPLLPATADDEGNQVPAILQGFPLKMMVPGPPQGNILPPTEGYIQLTWKGSRLPSPIHRYTTPVDPADFIEMILPGNLTSEPGKHELGYFIDQGGNESDSVALQINVDATSPTPILEVIVPPEVERDGITKKYLDAHGSIPVTVPEYGGAKIGDVVRVYIGTSLPLPTPVGVFTREDLSVPIVVQLREAMLNGEEGVRALYYQLVDRKGNESRNSPYKRLNVTLTDPPEDLVPPDIPLYNDNLIDLADAQQPVGVGLQDEYTNYLPGDQLVVTWEGLRQAPAEITSFPFYVNVPFRDVFNFNGDVKEVDVGYQIKRGIIHHPLIPITVPVNVDLRKPGAPVDPDKPGNPNPDLDVVTVQGSGGNGPNQLRASDIDQKVAVTAPIYTGAKDGDVVTLFWMGVEVSAAEGGVIDITMPMTELSWELEWSVIDAGGNGNPIPVNYKITHPAINDNKDISRPESVDVLFQPALIPDVKFIHLHAIYREWLFCGSLRTDSVAGRHFEVLVAGGQDQLANQVLKFEYQGYSDSDGSNTKDDTHLVVEYTPSIAEATDGFIVKIPYDGALKTTANGWGGIQYSAIIDGHLTKSVRHLVRVYLIPSGGGDTCPL